MGIITQVVLPLAVAYIMFAMGLALVGDDFKRVVLKPRAFAVGVVCQMVLMPLIALGLALFWTEALGLSPVMAVGVMLLAAVPGGITSNMLTYLAKGDTALSISLTAVISIVSVLTIPFIVNFAIDLFLGQEAVHLPLLRTVIGIFAITTVPVLIGMAVNRWAPAIANRLEPLARLSATIVFALIVVVAVVSEWDLLRDNFAEVGGVVLALNLTTMAAGWAIAKAMRLERGARIAISLEMGLQNGTLAVFVAATLLGNEALIVPAGVYALVMFFTSGVLVARIAHRAPAAAA